LRDVPEKGYSPEDFRFTKSKDGKILYAFCLGSPAEEVRITSLGRNSKLAGKRIASVQMLGNKTKLDWKLEDDAVVIKRPANLAASPATGFRIAFAN
jgi:alpha-L-fucosidase